MQPGEILPSEPAALEQHHGERIAQGERGGRAGRGRQPQGAGLAGHAVEEAQISVLRELRVGIAGEGDDGELEALQHGQQPQHLGALAAVAEQHREIARCTQAEVAVQCLGGVEKTRSDARAVEGAGQFLRDVRRLAHTAEDEFPAGLRRGLHRLHDRHERCVERLGRGLQCLHFDPDALAAANQGGLGVVSHLGFVLEMYVG